jgi:hypothetical protein
LAAKKRTVPVSFLELHNAFIICSPGLCCVRAAATALVSVAAIFEREGRMRMISRRTIFRSTVLSVAAMFASSSADARTAEQVYQDSRTVCPEANDAMVARLPLNASRAADAAEAVIINFIAKRQYSATDEALMLRLCDTYSDGYKAGMQKILQMYKDSH